VVRGRDYYWCGGGGIGPSGVEKGWTLAGWRRDRSLGGGRIGTGGEEKEWAVVGWRKDGCW
jgi:hypothetical protein